MTPRLSIVIPAKVLSDNLIDLLSSCLTQSAVQDTEILVVYRKIAISNLLENPRIKYINVDEENVSKARNLGADRALSSFILFLDDDVILPSKNYIQKLIFILSTISPEDILGGGYLSSKNISWIAQAGNAIANLWIQSGWTSNENSQGLRRGQFLVGGALCASKSTLASVSFSENIPWGGEDTVFLKHAAMTGKNFFYSKDLDVIHKGSPSFPKFIRRSWLSGKTHATHAIPSADKAKKWAVLSENISMDLFFLLPLLGLHFFVLVVAKLFYRFQSRIPTDTKQWFHLETPSNKEE